MSDRKAARRNHPPTEEAPNKADPRGAAAAGRGGGAHGGCRRGGRLRALHPRRGLPARDHLPAADGSFVRVRDLATVEDAHEEVRVVTAFGDQPCVKLSVLKQAEANTVNVSRRVAARLEELRPLIPPDIQFGVVENQGDYVMAGIKSVRDAAIVAAILVVFVVYLALGRWRQVAVMVIALPVTVLANFFLMRAAVGELDRPTGVEFEMGGQAQMMHENRRALGLILIFAFFFAYVVLALQFESFVQPFLIMIRVPLTLLGVVAALLVSGMPIGVTVLIGVVILAGNEVNHGVVLLEFINELRARGASLREAILEASAIRLRPIVMTLFTSIMRMLPLALNLGEGGDMLVPMAVAVIGGLLFSVVMTLVFLPCAYAILPGRPGLQEPGPKAVEGEDV